MKLDLLPTDNLYKFLSVFGLLSALYCFTVQYSLSQKQGEISYESGKKLGLAHINLAQKLAEKIYY